MYDFETLVDRRGTTSSKWHMIETDMGPGNEDVIALSVADMEFKPAPEIVEALVHAAQHDIFGYDYATDRYFDALVGWMRRRHALDIKPEWVTLSDGVMPAVNTALRAVTHPGDSVIVQSPSYPPFVAAARNNGLTLLDNTLKLEDGRYVMDYEDLEAKASDPRCTAIMLCNPHNPVGRVWSADELRRLADICIEHGVTILVRRDPRRLRTPRPQGHDVLEPGGALRHALHGIHRAHQDLQPGRACCAPTSSSRTRNSSAPSTWPPRTSPVLTVSHFGLVACQAAYNHAEPWLDELIGVLQGNLALLRDFAHATGTTLIEPEGTYLGWLDCRSLGFADADALCSFMRDKAPRLSG